MPFFDPSIVVHDHPDYIPWITKVPPMPDSAASLQPLRKVSVYTPVDGSWFLPVVADIRAGRQVKIILSPANVMELSNIIATKAKSAEGFGAFLAPKALASLMPSAVIPAASLASTALLIGNLAAVGAVGGLGGTLAVVIGMAHMAKMTVKMGIELPPDLSDGDFAIEFV